MSKVIKHMIEGSVGIIELARPEKFNCLSLSTLEDIDKARVKFETNVDVRSILIRAQGKYFCTGADLIEVKGTLKSEAALDHFIAFGQDVLLRLETSPLPVIVAVQGLCLAGGLELMLAADISIIGDSTKIGDQHAQFGLIPGWGGSQRLTRILGLRRAMDLFFSARWVKSGEALATGLVNMVVPDDQLQEAAMSYCLKLSTRSRTGIAEMKRLAREGSQMTLSASMRLERDAAVRHLAGKDVAEGLEAFEVGRAPNFK